MSMFDKINPNLSPQQKSHIKTLSLSAIGVLIVMFIMVVFGRCGGF